MKLTLKNTLLRVDLLMMLFPVLAIALGEGSGVCKLMISLIAHELAHLAAARCAHIRIDSIRLTPFGGMLQLQNPYLLPPSRLIAVAIAGPAANLLLILCTATACHWTAQIPEAARELIGINAVLLLFNLFPALPLDGGRILWALLSLRMSRKLAMRIALTSGRLLALLLILTALAGYAVDRRLNLSLLISAVFLLVSGKDEREALQNSRAETILGGIRPLAHPVPAEVIAVDLSASPQEALLAVHAGKRPLFAVFRGGRLVQIVDEPTLLDLLTSSAKNP